MALGRDRTFQSLALTVLLQVLAIAGIEGLGIAFPGLKLLGIPIAEAFDPFRTVATVTDPVTGALAPSVRPSLVFIVSALGMATVLVSAGIVLLRVWNPGRNEPREMREGQEAAAEQIVESSPP